MPGAVGGPPGARRLAVVGAGWAGLSAAVRAVSDGWQVTLFDTASEPGGRARTVQIDGRTCDNGQHILIGAYSATLALMDQVGVDRGKAFLRCPLALVGPDGQGLRLPGGHPVPAFALAVLRHRRWGWTERLATLRKAAGWVLGGFSAGAHRTVADLCRDWPSQVRRDLIDPLCVAALNTPADEASARVFLRVLRDALFSGPGAADLLLPAAPLGELLPSPAVAWLTARGAQWRPRQRVRRLEPVEGQWQVDGEAFDAVVLACPSTEAARLAAEVAPDWARVAGAFRYEPIVTVLLEYPGARLAAPMVSLTDGPAQFAFDLGAIAHQPGLFTFVISAAAPWVDAGREATAQAVVKQAMKCLLKPQQTQSASPEPPEPPHVLAVTAEKRATFRCTADLVRPPARIAAGLWAAGDYVHGPYPATLEGAVRAGQEAAQGALRECHDAAATLAMQKCDVDPS